MVSPEQDQSPLPNLPSRAKGGHKGTFGRVLVVAGSLGMSGAAALTGEAALRMGSGLVYVATAESIVPTIGALVRELVLVHAHEAPVGNLSASAADTILPLAEKCDAVAIGPGLGTAEGTGALVHQLVRKIEKPLLVDADGLNLLAGHTELVEARNAPTVLTPHPGEFKRLSRDDQAPKEHHRVTAACRLSRQLGAVVVLKGKATVIADHNRYALNTTGNNGLATAGTGDVLSGMIVSLLGQGMEIYDAARLGVHLHGRAGDFAAERLGPRSMLAGDVITALPEAIRELEAE